MSGSPDPRIVRLLYIGLWVLVGSAVAVLRTHYAFTFPPPWNDETAFLLQAFSLATDGTTYTTTLNPDRPVMWMPPGYMVFLAVMFKIAGYGFDLARTLSGISFCLAVAVLLCTLYRICNARHATLILVGAALALLSPYTLLISNVARMEAFFLLFITCAIWLSVTGYHRTALALLVAAATIHFNAIYFFMAAVAVAIKSRMTKTFRTGGTFELTICLLLVLPAMMYVAYVLKNIEAFMVDMAFQFSLKSALNRLAGSTPPLLATAASVMAMAILITERHGHTASCCAAYAAAFFAMALLGHNFWYDYGIQIGALLVLVTMCKASDTARDKASAMHILIKAALLVGLTALFARETPTVSPLISNIVRSVPQTPDSRDLESISEFVRSAPPGTKIDMGYSGIEGFFFLDFQQSSAALSIPWRSVTETHIKRKNDVRVFCDGPSFPAYLGMFDPPPYKRQGNHIDCHIDWLEGQTPP